MLQKFALTDEQIVEVLGTNLEESNEDFKVQKKVSHNAAVIHGEILI